MAYLRCTPVIGVFLIIQVPDPSDKRRAAILFCPINRFVLCSERAEELVRVIFDDIIVDRLSFLVVL
jgi:hypothetical protein